MKRFGNLYPQICTFDNLLAAFYKARKGKRQNTKVAAFEAHLEYELLQLVEELKTKTYQPGNYTTFMIYDPKQRMISAAPFRDRVVHHALCNIIEPIFERTYIHDTYANRKGKGTHAAIRRCQYFSKKYKYVFKADIKKYFPSIDHDILKACIRKKIKCSDTLWLIDKIIDNSNPQEATMDYFEGDDLFTLQNRRKGLPMGNLTSQFFANVYLSSFDHFVKEKLGIKGYIRYVDDFVIFHQSKEQLHLIKKAVSNFLTSFNRLYLHLRKSIVFPTSNGISFLGQRIFHTHRKILRQNILRFYRRMIIRANDFFADQLNGATLECQLNSWLGHVRHAHTFGFLAKVYSKLRQVYRLPVFQTYEHTWKVLY